MVASAPIVLSSLTNSLSLIRCDRTYHVTAALRDPEIVEGARESFRLIELKTHIKSALTKPAEAFIDSREVFLFWKKGIAVWVQWNVAGFDTT